MSERPEILPDWWFVVGDIVTRDGVDEHLILDTFEEGEKDYAPDLILVRCIKAPPGFWCRVGEEETNLARRYHLVRRANGTTSRIGA